MIIKIIAINIIIKSENSKDYDNIPELFYGIIPELSPRKIIKQIKNVGSAKSYEIKKITRTKDLHIWIYKHEIEIMNTLVHELFKRTYALILKSRKNIELILQSHHKIKD